MDYQFDLVGKIGSMALIRKEDKDIDYNIFSRLGAELKPGMIWVTSGATEIGRLDYLKRTGCELCGSDDEIKADYAAQGQSILMQNYRQFIHQEYGVRQLLVLTGVLFVFGCICDNWYFTERAPKVGGQAVLGRQ